jgi:hypothetical protein
MLAPQSAGLGEFRAEILFKGRVFLLTSRWRETHLSADSKMAFAPTPQSS